MNHLILNPLRIFADIWRHRYLLGQLIKRDVLLRYRGSLFGVLWIFISPLLMLAIFAFIFGQIFPTRWPQHVDAPPPWLLLYSGLIAFNLFSETVSRAPTSVRGYPSFVKKIIFPLDILPIVPLGASLVHGAFNFMVLLAALAGTGRLHTEILLFPLLAAPLVLLALGLSWFLAAWGVFLKDINHVVPVFMQILLFLSPVFYPVSAVPLAVRPFYRYNPLGTVIESSRSAVIGLPIEWGSWGIALGVCLVVSILGYTFFQRSREEFADVL
ncbi:MAG: ABC transporter permease [Burkholderiales bacterium]